MFEETLEEMMARFDAEDDAYNEALDEDVEIFLEKSKKDPDFYIGKDLKEVLRKDA